MAAIPGEWYAGRHQIDPQEIRYVYAKHDGDEYIVAKVWAGDDQDYEGTARLVAAAPELLECCRRLLAIVESEYESDPEPEDLDSWRDAIQMTTGCIAKAEGRDE